MSLLIYTIEVHNVFDKRAGHTSELDSPTTHRLATPFNPNISTMPNREQLKLEGRLSLAIQAYNSGRFKSLRAAARSYDVPHSTLATRHHSTSPRRDTRLSMCKLTSKQEEVVL